MGFATQPDLPTRLPEEDVNAAEVRTRQSMAPNRNLLFNGWGLTPAGEHVPVSDMPLKMVIAPDHKAVVAICSSFNKVGINLVSLDAKHEVQYLPLDEAFNGLVFSRDGKRFFASSGTRGVIYVFDYEAGQARLAREVKLDAKDSQVFLAGLAVHPATGTLYVCNEAGQEVWALNPETLAVEHRIVVGQYPHSCLIGGDNRHLYVSNWGSRCVSIIDTRTHRRLRDIAVGIRPNDLALAPDGRLFVACAGDNSVHVITTAKLEAPGPDASPSRPLWAGTREIISTSLYPQSPEGSTPCSVTVAPDGKTLFVANADNNCVMVVDISGSLMETAARREEKISLVNGFIPVGWYPSAVAVSPDNKYLLVANGKGLSSRPNTPAQGKARRRAPNFDPPGRLLAGSISFIARPDAAQMAAYTEQVRRNSPFRPEHLASAPLSHDSIIPSDNSQPCPIKYVLYIIKENRTYDQVFGDLTDAQGRPLGNGDPKLAIFGERITPNHHALAREYVVLDNLYANGEVSVDGHSWCDAAIATDFIQRSWIISYSKHGRLPGNEEMETPANGYLWDLCRRHGLSYKTYGEGAQRIPSANRGQWHGERDTDKVKHWLADLARAEQTGVLPRFTIMALPENHTKGTTPGAPTPNACVASNDLALGQIVAAATRSRFWKEMAIFVIEDDTQNGPDHVDAHRAPALVISPYTKRQFVDHTLYTTASIIRTMELILGLPPLTQYDAGATPMFNCFQKTAVLTPYEVRPARVDLNERNTEKSPFARESSRMNFKDVDLAPEDELNRILWHVARPHEPYPTPIHGALFTKPTG
ncbi:MAG: SMP-30/gluconolactonase/LRE family protein [Opitutae bacterium]|nr:SMP-30/gluconolactonase/LRE family protein [Opitutae bacterium]